VDVDVRCASGEGKQGGPANDLTGVSARIGNQMLVCAFVDRGGTAQIAVDWTTGISGGMDGCISVHSIAWLLDAFL
jgi:hypothetical protein